MSHDAQDRATRSGASPARSRRAFLVGAAVTLPVAAFAVVRAGTDAGKGATVFHEEFDRDAPEGEFTAVYGDRLRPYSEGWRDTSGIGTYRPHEVLSVHDGVLDFRLQLIDGAPAAAAVVPVIDGYGQTYGRYTVRLRADPVPGWKIAFLLWPDSEKWPDDGEIDFPDADLDQTIGAFLHHATSAGSLEEFPTGTGLDAWHTVVIEWSPDLVEFHLDGVLVGSSTTGVPHESMHFVLQTETGSTAGQPGGGPTAHAHVLVDHVTIESHPWT